MRKQQGKISPEKHHNMLHRELCDQAVGSKGENGTEQTLGR